MKRAKKFRPRTTTDRYGGSFGVSTGKTCDSSKEHVLVDDLSAYGSVCLLPVKAEKLARDLLAAVAHVREAKR